MFALVIRTCAWDEIPLGDNVEMGTSRSLARPLGDARLGWREPWLSAPSRESEEEESPFHVLCSCCLMFTGVSLSFTSILLLKRLELCMGCNLELCFFPHGQCFDVHTTWEVNTAALGQGSFPRGREEEDSSTGGKQGCVLQIKTVCTSVLEKTLSKHLWGDWYHFCAIKGVRHFAGNEGLLCFMEEMGLCRSKPAGQSWTVLLPPASFQCWWRMWRDPHHWALLGLTRGVCGLKNLLLCLFSLSYAEKKSQTASSTAVFRALRKVMKGRQWRVLSQSPVPCGGGVLGFSSKAEEFACPFQRTSVHTSSELTAVIPSSCWKIEHSSCYFSWFFSSVLLKAMQKDTTSCISTVWAHECVQWIQVLYSWPWRQFLLQFTWHGLFWLLAATYG